MTKRISQRGVGIAAASFLLALAAGCGPIAFSDGNALAINGNAPVEEAAPEPEPEPEPKRVEVRSNKIVISEKIQFAVNSAEILEVSHSLLDEVAEVIKENPHIQRLEIQGHASAEGNDRYNLKLSDKRAKAVREYLTGNGGIAEKKLTAKGYGETKPIADNETEEGREQNRRVEFEITKQKEKKTKVEIDAEGKEKVISEKTEATGRDAAATKRKKAANRGRAAGRKK